MTLEEVSMLTSTSIHDVIHIRVAVSAWIRAGYRDVERGMEMLGRRDRGEQLKFNGYESAAMWAAERRLKA